MYEPSLPWHPHVDQLLPIGVLGKDSIDVGKIGIIRRRELSRLGPSSIVLGDVWRGMARVPARAVCARLFRRFN